MEIKTEQNYNFACYFMWVWKLVSLTKEKHKLRVFETRVLEKIVGTKRGKVTGDWGRLHNV